MKWVKQSIHYWCPDTKEQKFLGQNVTVAILDTGISPHPDFKGRILSFRDFSNTTGSSEKVLFSFSHFSPLIDNSGHGTHVTGIAAGNGRVQIVNRGVAYEASLLVIKLGAPGPMGFPSTTQLMQAVDFSVRFATEHQLPLSINLSFGNTYGSHSGTSLLETYLNSVSDLGRICIITGSGNEGNNGGHVGGRLLSNTSKSLEFVVGDYERNLSIQIWKNYWDEIRIQLLSPFSQAPIQIPNTPGSWRFAVGDTELLIYYGEPSPYSLYQELYIDFISSRTYISSGIWTFLRNNFYLLISTY